MLLIVTGNVLSFSKDNAVNSKRSQQLTHSVFQTVNAIKSERLRFLKR
jgi:hypothetical protein